MEAFPVTAVDSLRPNQTVRHVYTKQVQYPNVRQGTWNRLEREFEVEKDSDVEVREPACGMDVDRIPQEMEVVGASRLEKLYAQDDLCGRCYEIVIA